MREASSSDDEADEASRDEPISSHIRCELARMDLIFSFGSLRRTGHAGGVDRQPRFPTEHSRDSNAGQLCLVNWLMPAPELGQLAM